MKLTDLYLETIFKCLEKYQNASVSKGIGWLPYFLPAVVFKASKAIVKQGGESKDVDVQQPQRRCSVDVVLRRSHIFKPVQIEAAEAVSLACVDVDMYIVLVFIGVVSLRYDNAAEWFQMAKSITYYTC